jgi:dephospho-CoA kinase
MNVIGLTGLPCVGKGMVKQFLFEWCEMHQLKAAHYSFSDEIRAEARNRGMAVAELDRDSIHAIVSDMRAREGAAVLADRLVKRIQTLPAESAADIYLVEAARHPLEVAHLRGAFKGAFYLIAVTAEIGRIVEWMTSRRRADESKSALSSREAAVALLEKELNGTQGVSVNVGACIGIADFIIENDGSLDELRAHTFALAERALLPR